MAARTRTKPAKAAEPAEEDVETNGLRPVSDLHTHMAEWLNEEYGDDLDKPLTARQVQIVIGKRNTYRKSDEYAEFMEGVEARRQQAEAARAEKAAAREDDEEDEAPAPRPRRPPGARP